MAHYLDYVGLNTFIYEPVGYDPSNEDVTQLAGFGVEYISIDVVPQVLHQNQIGHLDSAKNIKGIERYKNFLFPAHLVDPQTGAHAANDAGLLRATASFFPALILHRNGPYGFPTWKQIRVGDNPLTRRQKKSNIFTFVREPGEEFSFKMAGKQHTLRSKYGAIEAYHESPVTSKYKPFVVSVGSIQGDSLSRFRIKASYGNAIAGFTNPEINNYYDFNDKESDEFNQIKKEYLNGGLDSDGSLVDSFESFTYREVVFPQKQYTYRNFKRQRTTFSFPWRYDRANRNSNGKISTGFGTAPVSQSVWPLDVTENWATTIVGASRLALGSETNEVFFGLDEGSDTNPGILWNRYSSFNKNNTTYLTFGLINTHFAPAPIYARRHTLIQSASVVSPCGMPIEGIRYGTTLGDIAMEHIPQGEAAWDTPSQSGRAPFYDTYNLYHVDLKSKYKDYSIIPEFRMSNHVKAYQSTGSTEQNLSIFELTGGLASTTGSAEANFYKIFTNTDFMEHFEFVKEEHKDFVKPSRLMLKCKAVKKFLPYDGFYPVQRSVEVAKQFFQSYSGSFTVTASSTSWGTGDKPEFAMQNVLAPMFAPGVLYNSIKSGVAVDYPIVTGSYMASGTEGSNENLNAILSHPTLDADQYMIRLKYDDSTDGIVNWDKRVPFKALIEPARHLSSYSIPTQEPHASGNVSASVFFSPKSGPLYKLMIHNYLAEIPEFFLKGKEFSRIASKKSSDPTVGNARKDHTYMMRVKMFKSTLSGTFAHGPLAVATDSGVETPQITDVNNFETFTMYSRPSAFGPPNIWRTANGANAKTVQDSREGYNYPFTPPYYHGEGWADIRFQPSETKKYTINEIVNQSTVEYFRWIDENTSAGTSPLYGNKALVGDKANDTFLQLSASLNLFAKASVSTTGQGANEQTIVVSTAENDDQHWVIQPHFESPMLNFNHLSASTSITLPLNGSESVPRGMWHQYGRIEEDPSKGIFMQVTDVPDKHIEIINGGVPESSAKDPTTSTTGSLMDLCGFNSAPVKMGQLADTKEVREAVVAVPFIEEEGRRKFFKLDEKEVRVAIQRSKGKSALALINQGFPEEIPESVQNMVDKMKHYVFPPPMDFYNDLRSVDPIAMYIFEFKHKFGKQDLADMWQGVQPNIGISHEEATAYSSHSLLEEELLGQNSDIPDRLRWMIFKVKQRAKVNFYDKSIIKQVGNASQGAIANVDQDIADSFESLLKAGNDSGPPISFNWPYDFFSLVELIKLEANVKFSEESKLPQTGGIMKSATQAIMRNIPKKADQDTSTEALVETNRTYYSAAGSTKITYSDGSTKWVAGDKTS